VTEMAQAAVDLLERRLAEPERAPEHVVLATRLVARSTTGPAQKASETT
jgi:DNA-binding LacI/PurR family transcriptional regulator